MNTRVKSAIGPDDVNDPVAEAAGDTTTADAATRGTAPDSRRVNPLARDPNHDATSAPTPSDPTGATGTTDADRAATFITGTATASPRAVCSAGRRTEVPERLAAEGACPCDEAAVFTAGRRAGPDVTLDEAPRCASDADDADEPPEPVESAKAAAGKAATAAPTPKATASAPTRPTNRSQPKADATSPAGRPYWIGWVWGRSVAATRAPHKQRGRPAATHHRSARFHRITLRRIGMSIIQPT